MDKQISISKLTIITPFKDNKNTKLYETIDYIYKQHFELVINHLIIYDYSCKEIINLENKFTNRRNYCLKYIPVFNEGIYYSINKGLDELTSGSHYIVIGAGDLISLNNLSKIKINKILFCKYKLSNKPYFFNKIRNIFSGMPYCHNAIIFKINNLRYSTKYKISSDYDYLLKYLRLEKINLVDRNIYIDDICIIFESITGISSKSIIKKNIENISILFVNFGLKSIIFYIMINLKKFIKKMYE